MRILLPLPIFFAVVSPCLAQPSEDAANSASAPNTSVRLLAGADYVEGDLGDDQQYETTSASIGVVLTSDRFTGSAALPYLSTSAPAEVIVSQGGLLGTPLFASSGSQSTEVRREGIGDVLLNAGYLLPVSGVDATIGAAVKLPTASRENGLGTGAVDYGVSGQLSKKIGAVIPFVSGGYTLVGKPEGFEVRDTLSATAGSHLLLGQSSSMTAFYSYEQSASSQIGDSQRLGIGLTTKVTDSLHLGIDGSAGLSDAAPNAKVGLRIGLDL